MKYNEYWSQACEGAETISGSHAVQFLSRAAKVSKGQLRHIWDIADHQKEGALNQQQFFVALRLLALAQRGAELSIAGLRNFTGIQLIPSIDPPPKEEEPEKPAPSPGAQQPQQPLFSWTITPEVAARYDNFFKSLDTRNAGFIDGKQGVTFFGKSGLPRPTLKKIWGLADVTQDGFLSLDEFRTAMHMVACIRNKRLTVTALPSALDPSGPNWLRIAGSDSAAPNAPNAPTNTNLPTSPPAPITPTMGASPQLSAQSAGHLPPGQTSPLMATSTIPLPPAASAPQTPIPMMPVVQPPESQSPVIAQATPHAPVPPQSTIQSQPSFSESAAANVAAREAEQARKEAESIRDALRKEKEEFERARREMQEMRAEMERLKIEKESLAIPVQPAAPTPSLKSSLPPSYGQNKQSSSSMTRTVLGAGSSSGNGSIGSSVTQASSQSSAPPQQATPVVNAPLNPTPQMPPQMSPPQMPSPQMPPPQSKSSVPTNSPNPVQSAVANRDKPVDLGADDDDIWDQPSPKSSALPGPSNVPVLSGKTNESEDSDSSDDDDDFWGGGMAPKPTLGPAGVQSTGQNGSKGFGGSELDDWIF